MNSQIIFISKVLIISLSISIFIKYIGNVIEITESTPIANYSLIAIILPSLILAIILGWRSKFKLKSKNFKN